MRAKNRASFRMEVTLPERRRAKRYLTLKNGAIAGAALVVMVVLPSLWSEFRPDSSGSGYLFPSGAQSTEATPPRQDAAIVVEGPSNGYTSRSDSMLLDPAVKDQLRAVAQAPATAVDQASFEHRTSQLGKGNRILISGGPEGVHMHAQPIPPPQ